MLDSEEIVKSHESEADAGAMTMSPAMATSWEPKWETVANALGYTEDGRPRSAPLG
jgi:hypothetical protein